jgi:hypothetical protein
MHDLLIALVFLAIIFSPAIVASLPRSEKEDEA